jgi:hypothetical protein
MEKTTKRGTSLFVPLAKYNQNNHVEDDEIGGAYGTKWGRKMKWRRRRKVGLGKPERKYP